MLCQIAKQRVYPRGRGGTGYRLAEFACLPGLSPRARGNRSLCSAKSPSKGSIPAGAGEPARVQTYEAPIEGLSPRARGNPRQRIRADFRDRSIPAGAGEPSRAGAPGPAAEVYPRGRGGTLYEYLAGDGSQVYPRGRGGTRFWCRAGLNPSGLSPRARGNRSTSGRGVSVIGSIPAGAGEPGKPAGEEGENGVYPRGRGGTCLVIARPFRKGGLSPRARGNRRSPRSCVRTKGSIPAGAGEPGGNARSALRARVYPRGRGGT